MKKAESKTEALQRQIKEMLSKCSVRDNENRDLSEKLVGY